jgi:hypothetical protein
MLTPYTSNDEVRATVGVTADELPDATLELEIYEKVLKMELDAIGGDAGNDGDLITAFKLIEAVAESQRSKVQARVYDAVILFSPFAVALHLETAVPLFAPKAITDGKAGLTRYSESPFKGVFKSVRENYDRFRTYLTRAWAAYSSAADNSVSVPTLFAISSPSTDPVTG